LSTLLKILSRLPLPALYVGAFPLYLLIYYVLRLRKHVVYTNLSNAFPDKRPQEIKKLAKNFYRNYSDVVVEMIKAITIDAEELDRRITITNQQEVEEFLNSGQSVIVMMAHHCNLEWLMLACCIKLNHPMDAVYKPLHNKYLDKLMLESRSRFGGHPISAKNTLQEIIKRKDMVRCFAIAPDQTPRAGDDKHWTQFLNQDTAFFIGVEKLARLTKYPVLFLGMKRITRGIYEASIKPLAVPPYTEPLETITQHYAQAVETQILSSPSDWLWSHKRWKHKKPIYA
jgi:KDO2-lipid IV(A) lauroyltransferase